MLTITLAAPLTELQRPEPSSSKKIAAVAQQSVQLLQSCDALLELAHELLELSGGGLFVGAAQGSELLAKARKIKTVRTVSNCLANLFRCVTGSFVSHFCCAFVCL